MNVVRYVLRAEVDLVTTPVNIEASSITIEFKQAIDTAIRRVLIERGMQHILAVEWVSMEERPKGD